MNQTIEQMVAHLFRNCVENEEVIAAREEITENCREHYSDLVQGGMSEAEASRVIAESLAGMDELVKSYPQREADSFDGAFEKAPEAPEAPQDFFSKDPANGITFDANGVTAIELSVVNHDLKIVPSADGRYHVVYDDEETAASMSAECVNGLLRLSCTEPLKRDISDSFKSFAADAGENVKSIDDVPGFLRKLGGFVSGSFKRAMSTMDDGLVTVEVPAPAMATCRINTTAGDISMDRVAFTELRVQSVSGDISISNTAVYQNAKVSSTSGDVELGLKAGGHVEVSAISGDVRLACEAGQRVVAHTTSGDVWAAPVCTDCEANSVSGDVEVQVKDQRISRMNVHTVSGNAKVTLPAGMSGNFRVNSKSGMVRNNYTQFGAAGPVNVEINSVSGLVELN